MRFLGLGLSDRVPDARTIWLFREQRQALSGYLAMSGQIIDTSLDRRWRPQLLPRRQFA
jgi:hypothetical protein